MSNLDSLTLDLDEQMQNVGNPNWRPKCYGCGQAIPEGEVAAKHSGRVRTLPTDPFAHGPVAPPGHPASRPTQRTPRPPTRSPTVAPPGLPPHPACRSTRTLIRDDGLFET